MNKVKITLLAAGVLLAMAFTFSCSGDDGGTDEPSSTSAENPSSSGIAPSSSSIPGNSGTPSSSSIPGSSGTVPSSSSSLPSSSSQAIVPVYGDPLTDARDSKTYKTVVIGKQTWMAENLDFETAEGSECYNNNALNCTLYGRQYTWDAAMNACPAGWHLPNGIEWVMLEDFIGGSREDAWTKLRATSYNSGTDDYGFSAFSAYYISGGYSGYWSSVERDIYFAYYRSFDGNYPSTTSNRKDKNSRIPVRCVKGDTYPTPSSSSYTPVSCTITEGKDFCDDRDGTPYKSVDIDGKIWMAENLNFNAEGSKCYGNDPANCEEYGRLYSWSTVMAFWGFESVCNKGDGADCSSWITENHKGICPNGWHVPSDAEFNELVTFAGGMVTAGKVLKAKSGWIDTEGNPSGNGADLLDFSAKPGGGECSYTPGFRLNCSVGSSGHWWNTSSSRTMYNDNDYVNLGVNSKFNLISLRCVQD